jgi:hypothetical protein
MQAPLSEDGGAFVFIFCIFESTKQLKMKTYQIQIEDNLFPELKRVLGFLPKDSVKLQTQAGYEIAIDNELSDFELSDEFETFIEEGIASLENGESFTTEQVLMEAKAKYPNLKFDYEDR